MAEIFRERTEQERNVSEGGFLDIRTWRAEDVLQTSMGKITDMEHDFIYNKRKPFCSHCAIEAVRERLNGIKKEINKAINIGKTELDINLKVDFAQFGADKKFKLVDETDIEEDKLLDNIRQRVRTGKYKNFVCLDCGAHSSIEFKNREYETKDAEKK